MRHRYLAAAAALLLLAAGDAGRAAYEARRDTMKELGRAYFLGVGRPVKGRAPFGPDTVAAAETLVRLSAKLDTLFPAESLVDGSNMKPGLPADPARVATLAAGVQARAAALLPAVRGGDKAAIAAAYAALGQACDACHTPFRKEE